VQPDTTTDFLIIGAGFSGLVAAERLASAGWKCTIVDRRQHIAGNAYDRSDAAGVLIHPYGPHYFRTNSEKVLQYLSRFTDWHPVDYTIKSFTQGTFWPFPINLNTFEQLIGRPSTESEFTTWLTQNRHNIPNPQNSEEAILAQVGTQLYEQFFQGYTLKQWQRHPRELDASVCARIPIRTNRDDRYLTESFQALPARGYTALFENLLATTPNITLHLGTDYLEAKQRIRHRHIIFTGPIDEYFQRRFGPLPYRSLRFEPESFTAAQLKSREPLSLKPGFWQPALQVNYPDPDVPYTRIVEIKHATGQQIDATTIIREYPKNWTPDDEPFYPVPAPDARAAYQKYATLAAAEPHTTFIGRLATYRYYNMDQVTAMALTATEKLLQKFGSP
jgi:UDP-galactopyranose mutase